MPNNNQNDMNRGAKQGGNKGQQQNVGQQNIRPNDRQPNRDRPQDRNR